jgi:DNA-binding GntR family transcriptional regulator
MVMSEDIDTIRSQSLASILQREIEKLILSGAFKGGDRLNENALATRFNVSRGPVREACRALSDTGLIEVIPNRGVFLRTISKEQAEELYDLRSGLFGLAARLLASKITDAQLGELERLLEMMEVAAHKASLEDYYPLNLEFHETLMRMTGNSRLVAEYLGLIKELHLFRARGLLKGGGLAISNDEHRMIFMALKARDPIEAFEAGYRHVQNAKTRMLGIAD